jgi:hypothetical protein
MSEQAGATPGVDRIIQFFVRGGEFRLRRPTRGDQAEILRRFTARLMRATPPLGDYTSQEIAKETLNGLDGGNLFSEARFEVLLLPRKNAADLGERAPAHWYSELKDPDQRVIAKVIAFDDVDPDEFAEAAKFVDDALQKKSAPATPSSTATAPSPTNA